MSKIFNYNSDRFELFEGIYLSLNKEEMGFDKEFGEFVVVIMNEAEFRYRVRKAAKKLGYDCVFGDVNYHAATNRGEPVAGNMLHLIRRDEIDINKLASENNVNTTIVSINGISMHTKESGEFALTGIPRESHQYVKGTFRLSFFAFQQLSGALQKVWNAVDIHGGTTLLSTGLTGDDARMARAAVAARARLLEPNHPAVVLARGLYGAKDMHAAEAVRHRLSLDEMLKVISGVRSAVGEEIFITVGVPGGFTEKQPIILEDEDFYNIARAGADGLYTHKTTLEDLEEWVTKAHKSGLLVDAYIAHPDDKHLLGIPARTPEEVGEAAQAIEQ